MSQPISAPVRSPVAASTMVPFWLPASHFVVGLAFVVAAAVVTTFNAHDLAGARFLMPRVAAAVHLVTLGWLTLSIIGALCQLFPVALGTPLHSVRLAVVTLVLYAPGVAAFAAGLFSGAQALVMSGAVLFSSAVLLFIYNAYRTLFSSKTRDLTWWTLAAAFAFLLATLAFGLSLALNLRTSHLGAGRPMALAIHVHVAVAGWVGLVIMAVGRRLLPMFLLSHGKDERWLRAAVYATIAGAGLLTLLHRVMTHAVFVIAVLLLVLGVAAFALQVRFYVRSRHRPQLDAGLRLVLSGVVFVVLAAILGTFIVATHSTPRLVTAYGIALLGGLMLFVAGHYYKILPFLLWNHRFAPHAGKRVLPTISDLYDRRIATAASASSIVALAGVFTGVMVNSAVLALCAAMLLVAGLAIEAVQLILLLRTKVI